MIGDFFQNFFLTLGLIWFFLISIRMLSRPPSVEKEEHITVNGEKFVKDSVIFASAEYVEQGSFKGWLVFENEKKSFMVQGITKEECNLELQKRFPNKTILITGFN